MLVRTTRLVLSWVGSVLPKSGGSRRAHCPSVTDGHPLKACFSLPLIPALLSSVGFFLAGSASATTITFHERAFADNVVASSLNAPYDQAASALGANDWTADMVGVNQWGPDIGVALGNGGFLTLEFTDNAFGSSGNDESDVWIFEIGGLPEEMSVEISVDGVAWLDVGIADRPNAAFDYGVGIDIDPFFNSSNGFDISTRFSFIRVTDTGNNTYGGGKAGADIDAVAAIYPISENVIVPEPTSGIMVGLGLMALSLRRRIQGIPRETKVS